MDRLVVDLAVDASDTLFATGIVEALQPGKAKHAVAVNRFDAGTRIWCAGLWGHRNWSRVPRA